MKGTDRRGFLKGLVGAAGGLLVAGVAKALPRELDWVVEKPELLWDPVETPASKAFVQQYSTNVEHLLKQPDSRLQKGTRLREQIILLDEEHIRANARIQIDEFWGYGEKGPVAVTLSKDGEAVLNSKYEFKILPGAARGSRVELHTLDALEGPLVATIFYARGEPYNWDDHDFDED
jgi:hypothetical protein